MTRYPSAQVRRRLGLSCSFVLAAATGVFVGCVDGGGSGSSCPPGTAFCPCYAGTCQFGLECVGNFCIAPGDESSDDGEPEDGDGDGDGSPGDGDGDGDGSPGDGDGDGDGGPGDGDGEPQTCPNQVLAGNLPIMVSGSNVGRGDDHQPECADYLGGEDVSFSWTVPADGQYHIDTAGSDFYTLLSIVPGVCPDLPDYYCNDDHPFDGYAKLDFEAEAGTELTIYVDAYNSDESGNYELRIEALDCPPPMSLGNTEPLHEWGMLADGASHIFGSCGGAGPEVAFTWTAPVAGDYQITTVGSSFDTVLYVLDGDCRGTELACDDDAVAPASSVHVDLAANQQIYIVVDAYNGSVSDYDLTIDLQ